MTKQEKLELVNKACTEYGDIDMSVEDCVRQYLNDNLIYHVKTEELVKLYMNEEAVSHGIPRDVVEGKKKLSDYFTQDYIDMQCNRKSDDDDGIVKKYLMH